jgi:hypothetical protein
MKDAIKFWGKNKICGYDSRQQFHPHIFFLLIGIFHKRSKVVYTFAEY